MIKETGMKLEMVDVSSSFIRRVGFATNGSREGLVLVQIGTSLYTYKGRRQAYVRALAAKGTGGSIGQHFQKWIKNRPVVSKLEVA
jgi:hypothetical protein